jgi:flagellar FliL protein
MFVINIAVALGSVFVNYSMIQSLRAEVRQPSSAGAADHVNPKEAKEYTFFRVEKVIVSLQDQEREHYFVLDLVLQADKDAETKKLEKLDPIVRNSVVAHLSKMTFAELRTMPIVELQAALEKSLFADLAGKNIATPFAHVLVSKLIVQ